MSSNSPTNPTTTAADAAAGTGGTYTNNENTTNTNTGISTPTPTPHAHLLDLSPTTSHPPTQYFALIIDNLLTPADCAALLALTTTTSDITTPWAIASVSQGNGAQKLQRERRHSQRLVRDDREAAGWVFERVRPFLEEFGVGVVARSSSGGEGEGEGEGEEGGGKFKFYPHMMVPPKTAKKAEALKGERWRVTRLNERLRFLKYEAGDFFVAHTDGSYSTHTHTHTGSTGPLDRDPTSTPPAPPAPEERSFLTLQLYLHSTPDLLGGATLFHPSLHDTSPEHQVRVEAVPGRALVFQHRGMVHSGERVERGVKVTLRTEVLYERIN
ncbi:hypothetical protein DFH27DRAFT_652724 [Peziza echinospora]|nr:hypothetical protein DFH27DRAFT_652724 [Peziza echinospora]